ncbi:MAG TPA: dienelactone hydrolase family protein [Gemmatimonadaceae bacterium]|nr:dienelactone hydrolase family protein [Gemmatimonadaceae bacterium]
MAASMNERDVSFLSGDAALRGVLSIPPRAKAIVIFAHGSGSNSRSKRNADTARTLFEEGFASLRADLLTDEETALNERTGQFRFDVKLLAERVLAATAFVGTVTEAQMLPIAYYGASTGAAAALTAAAKRRDVYAVISRGGRPDLAISCLPDVRAATLLIVGGADVPIIPLNEEALALLAGEKELAIVPAATHLFEEPGALEEVGRLTVDWLTRHLPRAPG